MHRWTRLFVVPFLFWCALAAYAEAPVQAAMERILDKLAAAFDAEHLMTLDEAAIQPFITPEDRQVLAEQYWRFDANVPVVVSVMRDEAQTAVPFWLLESGFKKTGLVVKNEEYTYEVWQKSFDAGPVGLGINGFDKHRPHYFVAVGPQHPGDKVVLSHFVPADQQVFEMKAGAYVYHDWPDLLLTHVPDTLNGQILLPTIRGRAREANLIDAFRKALYPGSETPDQAVLTWSDDPKTTQTIQWRCKTPGAVVRYRAASSPADAPWQNASAECVPLSDRLIVNETTVNHCVATLRNLEPGTKYVYRIDGTPEADFTTAPAGDEPFTFFWMSDTHKNPIVRDLLATGMAQCPKPAFLTISGDLIGMGQYRDDWESLFHHGEDFLRHFPLMPSMGNHDNIDGMGADLYRTLFSLPKNGPGGIESNRTYQFQYGNALFLMLDATMPIAEQAPWIEEQLRTNTAKWTFAVFHFPPYAPDDKNPDIVAQWLPLFDQYHVDFVLTGHVHHYLRTYPMKAGHRVESSRDGTVYYITISIAGPDEHIPKPEYAAAFDSAGTALCTLFHVGADSVTSRAIDPAGRVIDEYTATK